MISNCDQRAAAIRRLLSRPEGHVHLVGAGGVGMAGIAELLRARGFTVSGCDAALNALTDWLAGRGVRIERGHSPTHLAGVDWVVRSRAVSDETAEIAAAAAGLPLFFRGEVLPRLLEGRVSIAVSGTHGKTTTTSFIAHILAAAQLDPSWCIGGEVPGLRGVAGEGGGGPVVVEADESDGTISLYEPDITVITNIEYDHMEHFASTEAFEDCFRAVIRNTRRCVVYCLDDPRCRVLAGAAARGVSYGFGAGADVSGSELAETPGGVSLTVRAGGRMLGVLVLPVPGRHNALNALAAVAVARELGIGFDRVREAFAGARLPARRFERVARLRGVPVISDYAHHPTEIAALVRTAAGLRPRRLLAVFQPHRYTRTAALAADFVPAFAGVDELVLTPVYAASERPLEGGTTADLYRRFREKETAGRVHLASALAPAWACLRRVLREGDVFLVIGAGDVVRIAQWAAREAEDVGDGGADLAPGTAARLRDRLPSSQVLEHEPVGGRTTFGTGGCADLAVCLGDDTDIRELLAFGRETSVPVRILGRGSNVLVSDLGLRGVTAWLDPRVYGRMAIEGGVMTAGAAAGLTRLARSAAEAGWGGLEFLEGIPGTLGGALRMNAGAFGGVMAERVEWVRCLGPDGVEVRLSAAELGAGYRCCAALADKVVVEAALRLSACDRAALAARRAAIAEKRDWMRGRRSAGSVFRNPPGDHAGRLIEAAGLKGCRVGGAVVTERHANVIEVAEGACSSDVLALIEIVRQRVLMQFGIELKPEIVFLE